MKACLLWRSHSLDNKTINPFIMFPLAVSLAWHTHLATMQLCLLHVTTSTVMSLRPAVPAAPAQVPAKDLEVHRPFQNRFKTVSKPFKNHFKTVSNPCDCCTRQFPSFNLFAVSGRSSTAFVYSFDLTNGTETLGLL